MNSKDNDKTVVGGFALDLIYSILSDNGDKFVINDKSIVGRGNDCEIVIDDKKVSRNHAQLSVVNGRLEVMDLESSNGTFVNGNKISQAVSLSNGDVVSFEKNLFTVNIAMNEQEADTSVAVDEEDDHTAVMDLSPEQMKKLHQGAGSVPPETANPQESDKQEVKPESPESSQGKSEEQVVPTSWIEETGAAEGTRMLDMSELEALRAGPKVVSNNDSDVTRLHCFIDGQAEEIVELPITDFNQASGWEIGRDSSCDIVLNHPSVSNRHAQIIHQNGRWKMVNLVSTNGIQINGQKRLSAYLSDGDKIGMGSVNLVIKIPQSHAAKVTKVNNKSSSNKNNVLIPVTLGLIIIVLILFIYFYK